MADIKNITQARAIATTIDESAFEHSVLVLSRMDDVSHVGREFQTMQIFYNMTKAPLQMVQAYFEEFAEILGANGVEVDRELAIVELAKQAVGESSEIFAKLDEFTKALRAALSTSEEIMGLTAGMAQTTKDLKVGIGTLQDGN